MYLNPKVSENGSYPALQSLPADGLLLFPDKFLPVFYPEDKRAAGFVTITDDRTTVTSCAWNEEAYQKWCAENPEPDYLAEAKANKEAEISSSCNAAIVAGMDVETTQGTEHFSLEETDQINLTTAYNAVLSGASQYPYHADGQLCRMFTAEEITAISNASIAHKLYHTTLCNHLLTWVRRAETDLEVESITYTAEGLPEDLAANMAQVLAAATSVSEEVSA